jgi:hypothetical protein
LNNLSEEQSKDARTEYLIGHVEKVLKLNPIQAWINQQASAASPDQPAWKHVMSQPAFEAEWERQVSERGLEIVRQHGLILTPTVVADRKDLTAARSLLLRALDSSCVDVYQILAPHGDWEPGEFCAIFKEAEDVLLFTHQPGGFLSDVVQLSVQACAAKDAHDAFRSRHLMNMVWEAWVRGTPNAIGARDLLCGTIRAILKSREEAFDGATFIAKIGDEIQVFSPNAVLIFDQEVEPGDITDNAPCYVTAAPDVCVIDDVRPYSTMDWCVGSHFVGVFQKKITFREEMVKRMRRNRIHQALVRTTDGYVLFSHQRYVDEARRDALLEAG